MSQEVICGACDKEYDIGTQDQRCPHPKLPQQPEQEVCPELHTILQRIVAKKGYDSNDYDQIIALINPDKIRRQEQMALSVIEGSSLIDEPTDKRLSFIYRMAHVGRGECEHKEWAEEMENCYQQLVKDNIV
ncbi:hypothetical protein LCGC14_1442620 [marine sediment metagenome]|uniref:Uncharacterized protein n=1 Tax=marine sediment metagenome TaxID=412755 RepID=A0A0F9JKU2_9ZZZZ